METVPAWSDLGAVMMMSVLFATNETCSVLGTGDFNLCMIKGFGFVVGLFVWVFLLQKCHIPLGFVDWAF